MDCPLCRAEPRCVVQFSNDFKNAMVILNHDTPAQSPPLYFPIPSFAKRLLRRLRRGNDMDCVNIVLEDLVYDALVSNEQIMRRMWERALSGKPFCAVWNRGDDREV